MAASILTQIDLALAILSTQGFVSSHSPHPNHLIHLMLPIHLTLPTHLKEV